MEDTGPKIVFLIRSNPCESHRPAEAIRIAAGLGVGKNLIKILLSGEAPRVLSSEEEELIDIEIIEKFLPFIEEMGIPFYVERDSPGQAALKSSPYGFRTIGTEESSELLAGGHYVLVF
ncbi:MAG: hypothetical protein HZA18_06280 [Nitrospirae bacterium]|nr:hypothetical protein [Nitrospirota bacterium]